MTKFTQPESAGISEQLSRSPPPLATFLHDLKSKRRHLQSALNQNHFEMESALRQLERNIEEVERERKRVEEIKKGNETKRIVEEFVSFDYSSSNSDSNDFELLCDRISELFSEHDDELIEKAVLSVLIPIIKIKSTSPSVDLYEKLRSVLPLNLYEQIIYNLWWPSIRHPHFTAPIESEEDWDGVIEILKRWATVLPDEFLVLFIGNQILLPRVHSLFSSICECDDQIVIKVWRLLVELKFNQVISILRNELITWLNNRIIKVQPKSFKELLTEFKIYWKEFNLEAAWLKRCEKLLQRDLIIDPSDQDLLPIECILSLNLVDFVSRKNICHVLTINLIPKLKKCVEKWMKATTVDFEEVAEWYVAWKEVFDEELLEENGGELVDGFGEIISIMDAEG